MTPSVAAPGNTNTSDAIASASYGVFTLPIIQTDITLAT